jgi:DNA-binding response OmpR family regulator
LRIASTAGRSSVSDATRSTWVAHLVATGRDEVATGSGEPEGSRDGSNWVRRIRHGIPVAAETSTSSFDAHLGAQRGDLAASILPMARILMIEDDAALAGLVRDYLKPFGYEVVAAGTAAEGLNRLREGWAAVLLDVMLPDIDGFEVCRRIRAGSDVSVLMLTARGQDEDRIVGLEIGADDYLPKPFNPRELLARLRAVLRRREAGPSKTDLLRFGRLELDRDARVVRLDGEERPLTSYQFDLLVALAESAGRVLGRETLMERAGHAAGEAFDRSIDVHVSRIRAAIEDDPRRPRRLLTVRGAGYVFARKQDED